MKELSYTKLAALLLIAGFGLVIPLAGAGANLYSITTDTSTLLNQPGGPFSVAFCLGDGSGLGDGNNTITLSAFDFGGGSAIGTPIRLGGASGSFFSSVTLIDSSFLNCLTQQFNPGSHIALQVSTTTNADTGQRPDVFAVLILDGAGRQLITQTGQPFFNPVASIVIDSASPTVHNYALISKLLVGAGNVGSMAHIASADTWATTFTLVNTGAASAHVRLNLFGDNGGPLLVPLDFPQLPASGTILGSSLERTVAPNATLVVNTTGPSTQPVQVGSAQLASTGTTTGFAIFRFNRSNQEAVVPLETSNAASYLLPFDNTNGVVLGVALQNVASQTANVPVVIRDDSGAQIGTALLAIAANGHMSFVLSTQFPISANKRGTIEFDTPPGGQISVLGIRTTPLGSKLTFTTIPALANVGSGGGSIAHLASGNGWKTTFVLVNTGTSAKQAHLRFFADNGTQLPLPLTFPQLGGGSATATTLDRALTGGATLVIESSGSDTSPLLTGSAQFATDGPISGFVIFRYNPNGQEAVVPLEYRAAGAYLLAFDNTGGIVTGVAVNNASAQPATVPVVIRDDTGVQIGTGSLSLDANGHTAFGLATQFPVTANIRGTIEFDTPAGGNIGALGIRTPPALTFTTLPALVK